MKDGGIIIAEEREMDFKHIILKKEEHVSSIVLNRPEAMNAINSEMFREFVAALKAVNEDDNARVMVLTGAGKAFCSSVDIKEAKAQAGEKLYPFMSAEAMRRHLRRFPQAVTLGIRNMEKPTIAMINGMAIADAFDWALACDIRIGSEKARFKNATVNMALFSNTGATWLQPRVMGMGKALELMYTGDWLEAEEALRIGVLNQLVPGDQLEEVTMSLAKKIAKGPPVVHRLIKIQAYRGQEISLEAALEAAADAEALCLQTKDHIEAVAAFVGKRDARFIGE